MERSERSSGGAKELLPIGGLCISEILLDGSILLASSSTSSVVLVASLVVTFCGSCSVFQPSGVINFLHF